ncbi:MAG: hypothetical protein NG737_03000 [Omnitrophica bacterium]|nr:hypothetical protein [Candidatus Omnitrophota bacterium]
MQLKLKKNLYSIDKNLLVKAGEAINDTVLDRAVEKARKIYLVKLKNTTILKDIKKAFLDERYAIIFSSKNAKQRILSVLGGISIPKTILAELKNLKINFPYTYLHIIMIAPLAMRVALHKDVRGKFSLKRIGELCLAHDIGKSRISKRIINKKTPLTAKEYRILRMHPLIGHVLLHYYYGKEHSKYDFVSYEHHERLDGSGYPRRIKKMSLYSQLIAIIDIFDALTSQRPYRSGTYSFRGAIDLLIDEAKKGRLNKRFVYSLIAFARHKQPILKGMKVSKFSRDLPPEWNAYGKIARK